MAPGPSRQSVAPGPSHTAAGHEDPNPSTEPAFGASHQEVEVQFRTTHGPMQSSRSPSPAVVAVTMAPGPSHIAVGHEDPNPSTDPAFGASQQELQVDLSLVGTKPCRESTFDLSQQELELDLSSALLKLRDGINNDDVQVYIKRSTVLHDVLTLYQDESIPHRSLHVEFLGEEGDDFGALTKELFTVFWSEATKELFAGEQCVTPILPLHRMRSDSWKFVSLGRILSHTVAMTDTIPPNLARSFLINLIFDSEVDDDCLLEDFLMFVTDRERRLLQKAMADCKALTSDEMERLVGFYSVNHFHALPAAGEVRNQVLAIADQELVRKPAPLCALMRKGIPSRHMEDFWQQLLTIKHISHIIQKLPLRRSLEL